MQGLLQKIGRAIQRFWQRWFGGSAPRVSTSSETVSLTDTDYEFLFMQLLDGVAHGWHEGRILKFFEKLGDRGRQRDWVAWLDRFGERLMSSAAINQALALRMIRLGELARTFPGVERIGETSYHVGYQLYSKETANLIWEYAGPDGEVVPLDSTEELAAGDEESPVLETISIEELLDRLQTDPTLVEQIAGQLGIEGTDPHQIIDSLIAQFQPEDQKTPETVEEGFQQELERGEGNDWEGAIVEYAGPDGEVVSRDSTEDLPAGDEESPVLETISIEELLDRLQTDPTLAEQIAGQLGIEGTDPHQIIDSLIAQFQPEDQKTPETVEEWFQRGLEQGNRNDWEGAIAAWDQALALDPALTSAWHNRGGALAMLGRYGEALESYDRALALSPEDEEIWNARGSALYGLQRWQEALDCWDRVLQSREDFYQAWYNRGSTLEKLDRIEEAIACYRRVLELDPDFDLAKTRLEALLDRNGLA